MAPLLPSYEYQGERIHAVFENRVIADGTEFAKVAQTAEEYLHSLKGERETKDKEAARKAATHIETPNGLQGEIISRVEGLWGDEITVRFENNQIRRFATAASDDIKYSVQAPEGPANYREALQTVLDEAVGPTRPGLTARLAQLDAVRQEASQHIAQTVSPTEQRAFHQIVLAADAEGMEVKEALAYLDAVDAENASPAAPVYAAVEQADLGRGAGDTWLDVTAREMIAESEAQDFDALLSEGPTTLVSSLDDSAIHSAGTVREAAVDHIMGKTAGFTGEKIAAYRETFVANAETARRNELTYRQETVRKEAAVKVASTDSIPDEGLFL